MLLLQIDYVTLLVLTPMVGISYLFFCIVLEEKYELVKKKKIRCAETFALLKNILHLIHLQ